MMKLLNVFFLKIVLQMVIFIMEIFVFDKRGTEKRAMIFEKVLTVLHGS